MKTTNVDNDYLTINDFAAEVGMTAESLRHYDRKGIFCPAKHGIELKNDYRYYEAAQITTVKLVRVLTEIGVSLQTIKDLSESRTPEAILKLLSKQQSVVAEELCFLQSVHSAIKTFLDLLIEGICAEEGDLCVYEKQERAITIGELNDFSDSETFYGEFSRFCNSQHEPVLNLSYPIGGFFDSMDTFLGSPSRPTRFFSINPNGHQKMRRGLYLTGYTRGYYGVTNDLPHRMAAYAKKNSLVFCGPVFNIYVHDELSIVDPNQYLLQVSATVMPKKSNHHNLFVCR